MIRVCEFTMDGHIFKLASMTSAQARAHVIEGRALLERNAKGEVSNEEWGLRSRQTVADSLNRAAQNGNAWTPEKIDEELDLPTINALFLEVLKFSGLRASTGEAEAVSVLPKSTAA